MKKSDLSASVAAEASLSKADAETAFNAVLGSIGDALAKGETVSIVGFGTFTVKDRPARQGRNFRTGESIAIAASKVSSFKAEKGLRVSVTGLGSANRLLIQSLSNRTIEPLSSPLVRN